MGKYVHNTINPVVISNSSDTYIPLNSARIIYGSQFREMYISSHLF